MKPIGTVLGALTNAWALVKAAVDERDEAKIRTAVSDMSSALLTANTRALELVEKLHLLESSNAELSEQLRELMHKSEQKARYVLAPISNIQSAFAYRLRSREELADNVDEPEHWVCQPCFDAGHKFVLRVDNNIAVCPGCKNVIQVNRRPPVVHRPISLI